MNDVGESILKLINTKGKSAAKMTEALKVLGDGKMEVGITRVAKYFQKDGFVKGSIATLSVIALATVVKKLIYDKFKEKSVTAEGEKILKELDEVFSEEKIVAEDNLTSSDIIKE